MENENVYIPQFETPKESPVKVFEGLQKAEIHLKQQTQEQNRFCEEKTDAQYSHYEEKLIPKNTAYLAPEGQREEVISKTDALIKLEYKFYPLLSAAKDEVEEAHQRLLNFNSDSEPEDYQVRMELADNIMVYADCDYNDGYGTPKENVAAVINNLPEGHRLIDLRQAIRGSGSFIVHTNKTDEELLEETTKALKSKAAGKQLTLKKTLSSKLNNYKHLVEQYKAEKKLALAADIDMLTKIPDKYAKAIQ
ncbi:transposase [Escherichia coli]|nr:transposase [Escherichia coli O113]EKP9409123.1 transposase [Escherichia coli]EMA0570127.1 transposase [Escherichia coli]